VSSFGLVASGTLLVAALQGTRPFWGDSYGYWLLSSTFIQNGHFSLLNFASPLRGYVFPLIIYVLKAVAGGISLSETWAAVLFNVVLYSLIGSVLAPRLAEIAWPDHRWGIRRRVLLTGLLLIFWSGDLNFPMSDFPGLTMALIALVAIARTDSPGWALIAGIAGGAAVNMRPAYIPLAPMLVIILGLAWFDQRGAHHASLARRGLCVGLLLIGFAAVSLPQSLSAHHYFNTWSFIAGTPEHLGIVQLNIGMVDQRFDAYVGPDPGDLKYPDEAGRLLLEQQPGHVVQSSSQYIGLFVTHPVVMFGLVIRHIIDGLDARYSTIYVEHIDSGGHLWMRLSGFLLVFLALARLLWSPARRSLGRHRWRYPVALSLCCLTSVTTRVETRYMLPLYLLSYMLVLTPGWPTPIGPASAGLRRLRAPAALGAGYLVFMAAIWHVVGNLNPPVSH
jgi:hypothetical protein